MPTKIYDDQDQDNDQRLYDEHGLAKNRPTADDEQSRYDREFAGITGQENYGREGVSRGGQQGQPSAESDGRTSSQRVLSRRRKPANTAAGTAGAASLADQEKAAVAGADAKEEQPDLAGAEKEAGLFNPEVKEKKKFLTKKNGIITLVAGGSTVTIIAALISLSSLLLPTLSVNTDNNRLARFTRNLMVNTDTITKLKLAYHSTGDAEYRDALRHYGGDFTDDGTAMGKFWAKFNRIRPEKIAERLLLDAQFNFTDKDLGGGLVRTKLTSFTLGEPPNQQTITVPEHNTSFTSKVTHPIQYFSSLIEYRKQTKGLVDNLWMQTDPDAGRLVRLFQAIAVRGKAASLLRQNLNISTVRWPKAEVDKANREGVEGDPATEEVQRSVGQTSGDGKRTLQAAAGDEDATKAAEQTTACFKDTACTTEAINEGDTIAPQARADLDTRFDPHSISNIASGVISFASSVVEIGNLACKMYDSSIFSSKDIINANSGMALASYSSMTAAADQQIFTGINPDDSRVNSEQLGGYTTQINGDIGDSQAGGAGRSNIMKIASGEPYDTSQSTSPQASAVGMFATNPFNFLPGNADDAMIALLGDPDALHAFPGLGTALALMDVSFCDVATNIWVQGSAAIIELGVALIPGVGQAIKGAGTAISKFAVWAVTKQVAKTIGKQFTLHNLAESGAYYAADNIISMIAMASAVQRMGGIFNGAALGDTYLNQADAGAEWLGQDLSRVYGGRALSAADYSSAEVVDDSFRVAVIQDQSMGERYFALHNPTSLTNRLAVASSSALLSFDTQSFVGGLSKTAANILNPTYFFSLLTGMGGKAFAEGEEPTSEVLMRDYGITQFGWTEDELEATRSNPNYSLFINEEELDNSGRRDEIAAKYGRCFDANTQPGNMLAGNPESGQIFGMLKGDTSGVLEKLPMVFRDNNANIIPDQGICAPNNTGDSGPDGDGRLTFKSAEAELVYRYRVSIFNNQTMDQMLEIQDPGPDTSGGGQATGVVTADGYSFPLDPKIKYSDVPCHSYTCHWDGTPAYDLYHGADGTMNGAPVFAISDGTIVTANPYPNGSAGPPVPGCYSIQFLSDDTFYYWYGHLQNLSEGIEPGKRVTAGQQIAEVANFNIGGSEAQSSRCRGGRDHLHIDRGCVKGGEPQKGGGKSCRDPSFIPFLTDLWLKQHY